MKHFNFCKTALLLVLMLMSVAKLSAQKAYAVHSLDKTTLTFYYDNGDNQEGGTIYNLPSSGVPGWNLNSSALKKITTVVFDESFADARPTTTNSWFAGMNNLTKIVGIENLNTSEVESMRSMFQGCYSLGTETESEDPYEEQDESVPLDLSHFDTSKVTDMNSMFDNCSGLTHLDLGSFDTSKVWEMEGMFRFCTALESINCFYYDEETYESGTHFVTSNVLTMKEMFNGCKKLQYIDSEPFDVRSVQNMQEMFSGCESLEDLYVLSEIYDEEGNPIDYSNVSLRNMKRMFYGCTSLQSVDLSGVKTDYVTDMSYLFSDCSALQNLDLGTLNTSRVTDMS